MVVGQVTERTSGCRNLTRAVNSASSADVIPRGRPSNVQRVTLCLGDDLVRDPGIHRPGMLRGILYTVIVANGARGSAWCKTLGRDRCRQDGARTHH